LSDSPIKINQVKASGGFTKSNLWLQIMSDVLNKELIVPAVGETSCLGTTFWVLKNHGVINNYQEFGDLIPNGKIFEPDRKESEVYQDIYQKYLQLYSNVSDLYK
jgi:gluconokinase